MNRVMEIFMAHNYELFRAIFDVPADKFNPVVCRELTGLLLELGTAAAESGLSHSTALRAHTLCALYSTLDSLSPQSVAALSPSLLAELQELRPAQLNSPSSYFSCAHSTGAEEKGNSNNKGDKMKMDTARVKMCGAELAVIYQRMADLAEAAAPLNEQLYDEMKKADPMSAEEIMMIRDLVLARPGPARYARLVVMSNAISRMREPEPSYSPSLIRTCGVPA